MYQKIYSCAVYGMDSYIFEIEVDITNGMPYFNILGINEMISRGIRERIRSAVSSCGFSLSPHKITVNMNFPSANSIREGLDLPIALGILCAEHLLPNTFCTDHIIIGNLSLNGEIRPVKGILNMAACCRDRGYTTLMVPAENAEEASIIQGLRILPVHTFSEAVDYWRGYQDLTPFPNRQLHYQSPSPESLQYIRGQLPGKRLLEIAAAGYHNLLLCGPPGCGKTLLVQSLPSLLPPPEDSEIPDLLRIRSISEPFSDLAFTRPIRQPHHSLSTHALIGGGHPIRPGEMTKAHGGILIMDEIAEFSRSVLENLRQPLESHNIHLHYLDETRHLPADFLLAATMNLCPCGMYPDTERCTCHPHAIRRYQTKLGSPLIERFDLCMQLQPVPLTDTHTLTSEAIASMKARIQHAYQLQKQRFCNEIFSHNSRMEASVIDHYCILTRDAQTIFHKAILQYHLSMRVQHNIKKTARSIADLADHTFIELSDIMEALQYRPRGFLNTPNTSALTAEYKSASYKAPAQTEEDQRTDFAE